MLTKPYHYQLIKDYLDMCGPCHDQECRENGNDRRKDANKTVSLSADKRSSTLEKQKTYSVSLGAQLQVACIVTMFYSS